MPILELAVFTSMFAAPLLNQWLSAKKNQELQKKQRDVQETLRTLGHEKAVEQQAKLHAFQREMEAAAHQNRLKDIEASFNNQLELQAYSASLANWPMIVPPYVMKDVALLSSVPSASGTYDTRVALHCILTKGNDEKFNGAIFKELESAVSIGINRHWNSFSSHPVIFYSGAVKETPQNFGVGAVARNLHTQLETLPVLVITPWITDAEENAFCFKVSLWGIQKDQPLFDVSYIPSGLSFAYRQKQASYTLEDKRLILTELVSSAQAFVGFIADQYYLAYYKTTPMLLTFLNDICKQNQSLLLEYEQACHGFYSLEKDQQDPSDSIDLPLKNRSRILRTQTLDFVDDILKVASVFANRVGLNDAWLLIRKDGVSAFTVRFVDEDANVLVFQEPFDFRIEFSAVKQRKAVHHLFAGKPHVAIPCTRLTSVSKKLNGEENECVFYY